jgi:hypothetical protein
MKVPTNAEKQHQRLALFPPLTQSLSQALIHRLQEPTLHLQLPRDNLRRPHATRRKHATTPQHIFLRLPSEPCLQIRPSKLELAHRRPRKTEEVASQAVLQGERLVVDFDCYGSGVGEVGLQLREEIGEVAWLRATRVVKMPTRRCAVERDEGLRVAENSWMICPRVLKSVSEHGYVEGQRADEAADLLRIHIVPHAAQCVELVEVVQAESAGF